jgi:NAD(P)-dependent dehydrogenase (short-subunit alcohol dehydrogenase family)
MMATGFAQNGAKVYIAARKEKQLQEAVNDINKVATGPKAQYIVANLNVCCCPTSLLNADINPDRRSRRKGATLLLKSSRSGRASFTSSSTTLGLHGVGHTTTSLKRRVGITCLR